MVLQLLIGGTGVAVSSLKLSSSFRLNAAVPQQSSYDDYHKANSSLKRPLL